MGKLLDGEGTVALAMEISAGKHEDMNAGAIMFVGAASGANLRVVDAFFQGPEREELPYGPTDAAKGIKPYPTQHYMDNLFNNDREAFYSNKTRIAWGKWGYQGHVLVLRCAEGTWHADDLQLPVDDADGVQLLVDDAGSASEKQPCAAAGPSEGIEEASSKKLGVVDETEESNAVIPIDAGTSTAVPEEVEEVSWKRHSKTE